MTKINIKPSGFFRSNSVGWQINILISQSFYLFLDCFYLFLPVSTYFCLFLYVSACFYLFLSVYVYFCMFLLHSSSLSILISLAVAIFWIHNIWRNSTAFIHQILSVSFDYLHLCLILSRFPACLHIFSLCMRFCAHHFAFPFMSCRAQQCFFFHTEVVL